MIVIKNRSLRTVLKYLIPFFFIPIAAVFGTKLFTTRAYLFVSFFVAILTVVLFLSGFETREVGTRRMVIVSVMIALCIAGRFIPFFKPITAITILTAVYLGGESGFMVGSFAALLSNFYFGQGPWTPFQMLAWGLIGLFAGYFSSLLKKNHIFLLMFGVLSGVVYSFIMDVWTVLWYDGKFHLALYLSAIVSALPHILLYAASNFIFLWFMAKPFGEKLERIQVKYGI